MSGRAEVGGGGNAGGVEKKSVLCLPEIWGGRNQARNGLDWVVPHLTNRWDLINDSNWDCQGCCCYVVT